MYPEDVFLDLQEKCASLQGAVFSETIDQVDLFYETPRGSLGALLKLRIVYEPMTGTVNAIQLIPYCKTYAPDGTNKSDYLLLVPTPLDPPQATKVLGHVFGPPWCSVGKLRSVWIHEWNGSRARIHFDRVRSLPNPFIEIEVVGKTGETETEFQTRQAHLALLEEVFQMDKYRFNRSYVDMLVEQQKTETSVAD